MKGSMELSNEKPILRLAFSKGRQLLTFARILKPVDNTPPGLIAFRLKVWNLVKTTQLGAFLDVTIENDPSRFVEQVSNEYRRAGWEVRLCMTAMYDGLGQAFVRNFLNLTAPQTAEELSAGLEQLKALIPRRSREPERPRWHFW